MLPAEHRLRRSDDFARTVRRGARAAKPAVVVHLALSPESLAPATVGFVVSKALGGAVQRNRVKRRLRAIMASTISELPLGTALVVRALPGAGAVDYHQLAADTRAATEAALRRAARGHR